MSCCTNGRHNLREEVRTELRDEDYLRKKVFDEYVVGNAKVELHTEWKATPLLKQC